MSNNCGTFLKRRPPPKQEATSAASPVSEFHKFGDTVLQHVMARIFVASQSLVFTVQGFSGAHFLCNCTGAQLQFQVSTSWGCKISFTPYRCSEKLCTRFLPINHFAAPTSKPQSTQTRTQRNALTRSTVAESCQETALNLSKETLKPGSRILGVPHSPVKAKPSLGHHPPGPEDKKMIQDNISTNIGLA